MSSWFFGERTGGPVARLVCFPYAGGGASVYRDWGQALERRYEVRPVELPGRGARRREQPALALDELVPQLDEELADELDDPYELFGYSLGALVAFELARYRRRRGRRLPQRLLVAAAAAPSASRTGTLHRLPDQALAERVSRWGGLPKAVQANENLLRLTMPALRSDLRLVETYAYRGEDPLACPIVAYVGSRDPIAGRDQMAGWEAETNDRFSLRELPGDHFFLRQSRAALLVSLASTP